MDINYFKGKKITVFGLGLHGGGVGTVKFLAKHGARVIVTDIKTKEQLATSLEKLKGLKNIEYVLGQHRREDFSKVDMVIKTPPAPWDNKNIKLALDNKVPVEMDATLFFKLCKNPIIGVTGTKGKTTIATMIYDMLKIVGKKPIKVGVGQESVLDKIDLLEKDSVVVFELSSWRLSGLEKIEISPQIAVFKNILPDHLNYYKSMDDYIADKENIFKFQNSKNFLIINGDDNVTCELAKKAKSQVIKFSQNPIKNGKSVFINNDKIYINNGIDVKEIISLEKIKIKGRHNIVNIMAAISAVYSFGIKIEEIKKAVGEIKGVPHRLEFVDEIDGVKYYNDTAATIPDATISAIESFEEPIILIAGGTDKNLNFSELAKKIVEKVKGLILLKGNATEKLVAELKKNFTNDNWDIKIVESMEKAVELASLSAKKGDCVVLSPGAASFGLFLNEFDRGNKFKKAVIDLKK